MLYNGSYEQCQFVLEALRSSRQPTSNPLVAARLIGRRKEKNDRSDDIGPHWRQGLLKDTEYHALLSGNIRRAGHDREPLWSVIAQEIANGHSTSPSYLIAAIKYCNVEALAKMLEIGWKAGPKRFWLSRSPLQHVDSLLEETQLGRDLTPTQPLSDMLQRVSGSFMVRMSRDS